MAPENGRASGSEVAGADREVRVTASMNADEDDFSHSVGAKMPAGEEEESKALLEGHEGAETSDNYRKRWNSIRIMYLTTFLTSIAFSILMTSLWPFLEKLGGTESFLGMVVGAYSLGQTIGSPIFGYWCQRRPYREPLVISTLINGLGNVMYCFSNWPADNKDWFLLVARFIVGFSGGNVAVSRAYISGATTVGERTHAMAMVSACQATGFIVGPLFGAAFSALHPGLQYRYFELDCYTAPAYLSAALAVVQLVLILVYFHEYQMDDDGAPVTDRLAKVRRGSKASANGSGSAAAAANGEDDKDDDDAPLLNDAEEGGAGDGIAEKAFQLDYWACAGCIAMFFMVIFVFALYETIGTPLAMKEYGWSDTKADFYMGVTFGVAGAISVVVFLAIRPLTERYGEQQLFTAGLVLIFIGFLIYLPWGPPSYTKCDLRWCASTPKLPIYQFFVGCFFVAVGYPACTVLVYIMYSKIVGPGPQGTSMGIISMAGSAARLVGPVYITNIFRYEGPRVAFASVAGMLLLTLVVTVFSYRRLHYPGVRRGTRFEPLR